MASFRIPNLALSWSVGVVFAVITFLIGYHLRDVFDGVVYSMPRFSASRTFTWADAPWNFVIVLGLQTLLCGVFAFISLCFFVLGFDGLTEKDLPREDDQLPSPSTHHDEHF